MYIVFFLLSRPPWKSAIAEGVSVNKYSFNNKNDIDDPVKPRHYSAWLEMTKFLKSLLICTITSS